MACRMDSRNSGRTSGAKFFTKKHLDRLDRPLERESFRGWNENLHGLGHNLDLDRRWSQNLSIPVKNRGPIGGYLYAFDAPAIHAGCAQLPRPSQAGQQFDNLEF